MKSIHLFTFAFAFFLFTACDNKNTPETSPIQEFTGIVESYGPLTASKNDNFFINFSKPIKNTEQQTLEKAFTIRPSVKGKLILNNNSLVFNPDAPLSSGKEYTINLNLTKLLESESGAKTLSFKSKVIPQDASFTFNDLSFQDNLWELEAKLLLNDAESLSILQDAINVSQDNENKNFTIDMESPEKAIILIRDIDQNKALNIKLNGSEISMDSDPTFVFDSFQDDDFSLIKQVEDSPQGTVSFIFNRILDENQNINGLINYDNSSKKPKYLVSGNKLIIYKDEKMSKKNLTISYSLKSKDGQKLAQNIVFETGGSDLLPKVKNVGFGHIIPGTNDVIFPFEAQGLKKVRLEIFEIHSQNLQQFFQQYDFDRTYNLEYIGEVAYSQTIDLRDLDAVFDPYSMKRYFIDLKDFIQKDVNSIYQLRLGFLPQDVVLECARDIEYDFDENEGSIFDAGYYGVFGYYDDYSWKDRDKPCKKGYYSENNYIEKMILSTNVGIMAKTSSNKDLFIVVNDIRTAEPIGGADINVYNKAQRLLASAKTDATGVYTFENLDDAYQIQVVSKGDENWLTLDSKDKLDVSQFDISGRTKKAGIDGFIYGERDVWRPGDTMHINFILHDPENKLPENHPVKLTIEDPKGNRVYEKTTSFHAGPIYTFKIPTSIDYNTGDYLIEAYLGASSFTKFIKIETIKPNKYAISSELSSVNLSDYRAEIFNNGKSFDINVDWLYGAPAKDKKVEVSQNMVRRSVNFDKHKAYRFTDSRNKWNPEPGERIAETSTNANGKASVNIKLDENLSPPGMLTLKYKITAFESSGDFSTDVFSVPFSPYKSYVGIKVARDIYGSTRIEKNKESNIEFINLSDDQVTLSNKQLNVKIYKMERYWWWNSYNDEFDMTNTSAHVSQDEFEIITDNQGNASISPTFRSNGRYYIQACDDESGHCTADYIYVGYVWDDEAMTMADYEEAAKLNFTSEKSSYKVGETVQLNIPSYFNGKALISLENGDGVVESFWTEVQRGINKVNFTAQLTMFPTIYANVTLLQKHSDKANDIPIRSYGIIPISIEDKSLMLNPEINTKSELKPKESFEVSIEEKDGKAMYYTLAVVDEGLLNISRFNTPDPFTAIYSRPSLGVTTYDMYNEVMAAYGNGISKLFSIGGDAPPIDVKDDLEVNRFKPVVRHIGPFQLKAKGKNKHIIQLPNYIGAVRVMVVAANDKQYGSSEKLIPVKQDLMLLATMPRQLAPGDQLDLPVTLFGMKDNLGTVNYGVETKNNFVQFNNKSGTAQFDKADEKVERLAGSTINSEGVESLRFYAKSRNLETTQNIDIAIKNPNPISRRVEKMILEAGETYEKVVDPIGPHESTISVSASSLFPINIEDHLDRLARYPYGCLEQRTSAAIAMLYKADLLGADNQSTSLDKVIVQDLLNDLYKFKAVNGYSLWPGYYYVDSWVTSYVGDFMTQAKSKGFSVTESVLNDWLTIQKSAARNWTSETPKYRYRYSNSIQQQAYRLFTLAQADNAMLSEMNRLREDHNLDENAAYLLAAAYSYAGRTDIANEIISDDYNAQNNNYYGSYGSKIRNQAIKALMAHKSENKTKMGDALLTLNELLSDATYLSTQTSSFVLRTLAETLPSIGKDKNISIDIAFDNNQTDKLISPNGVVYIEDQFPASKKLYLKNNTDKNIYVQISKRAKEALGQENIESSKLKMTTKYLDIDGKPLDVKNINLGTTVVIHTTIQKDNSASGNFENLALRQALPSGWEIINTRVTDFYAQEATGLEYQDFRDNQVNSFFSLEDKNVITVKLMAKATYPGTFYYPKTLCESMYVDDIFAEQAGFSSTVMR